MLPERNFLVLNALYLKKAAAREDVVEVVGHAGLAPPEARALLDAAVAEGEVLDLGGQLMLAQAGTDRVLAHYRTAHPEVRADPEVLAWYDRFEGLNAQFIRAVSEWQRGEGDPRGAEKVAKMVSRLVKALGELARRVPRYEAYARRFERSLARVDGGALEFISSPSVDSLHNVWFEFHEDILAVLGRPRTA